MIRRSFMAAAALLLSSGCGSITFGEPTFTGTSMLSTGGSACTEEWAQFRASRGHAYAGQCAGLENEAGIVRIHKRENEIYRAGKNIEQGRQSRIANQRVTGALNKDRATLQSFAPLRPYMDEATARRYDDTVDTYDAAVELMAEIDANDRAAIARQQEEIHRLEAEQLAEAVDMLRAMPAAIWEERFQQTGMSDADVQMWIGMLRTFGMAQTGSAPPVETAEATRPAADTFDSPAFAPIVPTVTRTLTAPAPGITITRRPTGG